MTAAAWVAISLFVAGHIGSGIWFASSVSSRISSLGEAVRTVRAETHADLSELRAEVAGMRKEFGGKIEELRVAMAGLQGRVDAR